MYVWQSQVTWQSVGSITGTGIQISMHEKNFAIREEKSRVLGRAGCSDEKVPDWFFTKKRDACDPFTADDCVSDVVNCPPLRRVSNAEAMRCCESKVDADSAPNESR